MQPLSELAKPDVDDLMRHMLGVTGRVAVELSTDIHKRSGGNPFFAKADHGRVEEALDVSGDSVELVGDLTQQQVEFPRPWR